MIAGSDTLTFQAGVFPNSGTTDTWLQGSSGNANQDTSTVLEWDGEDLGGQNFLLLRFDEIFGTLPGQIQPTDVIVSATLTYSCIDPGDVASVNEVLVDWSPPSPTTFNNFGGDPGVQTDEFGAPLGIASGAVGVHSLNVTSSIASWALNPSLNRGWIFRPTQGTNGAQIHSSEAGQLTERPLLTVVINETVNDCDDNGVLDSCDLTAPGSDENADGILDLCQGSPFRRGDGNQDGSLDVTDAIQILALLFGNLPSDCPAALDFNGDGELNIADVISELDFIFQGGPAPAAPYPQCGIPVGSLDDSCESFTGCP
ncbi:MAG: DNRLRE domain-containing protein [Planctomycetota bacterium]